MTKFLIFSHGYEENTGGIICLHKLCHLLNASGNQAFLTPYFANYEVSSRDCVKPIVRLAKGGTRYRRGYVTNPELDTPVVRKPALGTRLDEFIVIYPEVVAGNPLKARRVVRWLLYPAGGHTGSVHYGTGELYVPYNKSFGRLEIPGSKMLSDELRIVHYPLSLYRPPSDSSPRSGTAYLLKKGKGKPLVHHPVDAIQIDRMGHREISEIFRRVQTFVSYDVYTAYSFFAAIAGCDSVVIPDEGLDEATWYPDPRDRDGISYGWDRLGHARATRHLVLPRLVDQEAQNLAAVKRFVANVEDFFGTRTREEFK